MAFCVRFIGLAVAVIVMVFASSGVNAGDKLMTGGIVVNAVTGEPIPGITVALFDDRGSVVGTDVTDSDGRWALESTWGICHLKEPPGGRGLFSSIVGVISWPVRTTARVVGRPVKAAIKGAARAAGGAALAGASVAAAGSGGAVAIAAASTAGKTVGSYAVEKVVGDPDDVLDEAQKPKPGSGQVRVRVWQSGFKDYSGITSVHTLDRVLDEENKELSLAVTDTVRLAPSDSDLPSRAPREIGIFRNITADPAIVAAGSRVKLSVDIVLPEVDDDQIYVIGRNLVTEQMIEFTRADGHRWETQIEIPAKGPYRDHPITVVAYRTKHEKLERDKKLEGKIEHEGGWDMKKPFPTDPAILASRNRAYVVVTVAKP